jgi:hypothetical protein
MTTDEKVVILSDSFCATLWILQGLVEDIGRKYKIDLSLLQNDLAKERERVIKILAS